MKTSGIVTFGRRLPNVTAASRRATPQELENEPFFK